MVGYLPRHICTIRNQKRDCNSIILFRVVLALARNAALFKESPDIDHPVLGTTNKVLSISTVELEELFLLETCKIDLTLEIVLVAFLDVLEEDLGGDVVVLLGRVENMRHEAGRAGVTSTVDPGDREELGKGLVVGWLKVETCNGVVLSLLLSDLELAPRLPLSVGIVKLTLALNEDISELAICSNPGVLNVFSEGRAEDFANGPDEMCANNWVVLGLDEEGDVLLGDTFNSGGYLAQVVDVCGIGEDRVGKGSLLSSSLLVAQREVVLEFRMGTKHVAVESGGDSLSMLF
ncbi:hypothetical protein HG530_000582 [Fusarium avenaceum]|nr:hypothetical protein HG530_000582 [Fusarium avenaceum]